MNVVGVLQIIAKGISIAEALYKAGMEAEPAFEALKNLITGAQEGNVTDAQLEDTEALLDQMIEDFNLDI